MVGMGAGGACRVTELVHSPWGPNMPTGIVIGLQFADGTLKVCGLFAGSLFVPAIGIEDVGKMMELRSDPPPLEVTVNCKNSSPVC